MVCGAVRKRAGGQQQAHADDKYQGDSCHLWLFRNQANPRTKRLFAGNHRCRAERRLHGCAFDGDLVEKRPSVGNARAVVQPPERQIVAGQLAVDLRQPRRQPHKRVEPVHGQKQQPQRAPDVIPAPIVRLLVEQHVDIGCSVRIQGLRRDINRWTEEAK